MPTIEVTLTVRGKNVVKEEEEALIQLEYDNLAVEVVAYVCPVHAQLPSTTLKKVKGRHVVEILVCCDSACDYILNRWENDDI